MSNIAYYNGSFAPIEQTFIPINDRGYYFGDGVYEVVYAYSKYPFALGDHMDRFYDSLRQAEITPRCGREELISLIKQAISMVEGDELTIYWQMTRGTAPRQHAYPDDSQSNLLITVSPHYTDPSIYTDGVKCITQEDDRWLRCNIKTLNLLPNVMATQLAVSKGCAEAILHRDGIVTEGASSSVCIVKDGSLIMRPFSPLILPSVTRLHIFELAQQLGINIIEKVFSLSELLDADEVLIASAGRHCLGVTAVDDKVYGDAPGPITMALHNAYQAMVQDAIAQG
ncbi:MAG: aminotransferase class IV [Christensenellales bacterium]|jgi:D-alanine transaminase